MTEINLNQMLARMRSMASAGGGAPSAADVDTDGFAALLKKSVDTVNDAQQNAGKMAQAFELGEANVSLSQVMLASQKASVSFQALLQVRNKLVEAYKDVMNMPI